MSTSSAQRELAALLARAVKNPALLRLLIEDLFTPAEIEDLALRWRIVQALHTGAPQRAIAERLGVSLAKITRGSRMLLNPRGGFARLLRSEPPY